MPRVKQLANKEQTYGSSTNKPKRIVSTITNVPTALMFVGRAALAVEAGCRRITLSKMAVFGTILYLNKGVTGNFPF